MNVRNEMHTADPQLNRDIREKTKQLKQLIEERNESAENQTKRFHDNSDNSSGGNIPPFTSRDSSTF